MNLEEFRRYAKDNNVIPVYRRVLVDSETPLGLYKKLAKNNPGTFLLEVSRARGSLVTVLIYWSTKPDNFDRA